MKKKFLLTMLIISVLTLMGGGNLNAQTYVAEINETEVKYGTLEAALEAAEAGQTVTLLSNIETNTTITIDKAITLSGGNSESKEDFKTLTYTGSGENARAINVACDGSDGDVVIKNLTIAAAAAERAINVITFPAHLTIHTVTATAANYAVNVAGSAINEELGSSTEVYIYRSTLNGKNTVNVASLGTNVLINESLINCNDDDTSENGDYAALCINKDASDASIIANNSTITVTEGSDSVAARVDVEDGVISFNEGQQYPVVYTAAIINYGNYYSNHNTLQDAINAAKTGETITVVRNIELTEIVPINKSITLDLNKKNIIYNCTCQNDDHRMFQIRETSSGSKGAVEVTIKNGSIINAAYKGRCVETRTGNVTLNLNDVVMEASGKYAQPLTITGENSSNYQGIEVNIIGTTISAEQGYAINTFNPVAMKIEGSEVSGWCALNIKNNTNSANAHGSTGSEFTITNSTIGGTNTLQSGSSNNFGTFVIEESNITINTTGNTTLAKAQETNENSQHIFVISKQGTNALTGVKINVGTETTLDGRILRIAGDGQTITDNEVKFPAKYADQLRAEGYTTGTPDENGLIQVTGVEDITGKEAFYNDVHYETLEGAISAANNASSTNSPIYLTKNVVIENTIEISKSLTLNLNNYSITYKNCTCQNDDHRMFQIREKSSGSKDALEVTIKNGSIINAAYKGRCVETRTGNITLNLNDVVLGTSGDFAQPLTITGESLESYENIVVNIIGSAIYAEQGYAINTFNPVTMNIEDSEVSGWCTLNIKNNSTTTTAHGSAGSVFTIKNSIMDGINTLDEGSSNSFGTFIIEESDITINTTGNTTLAKAQETNENSQHIFLISKRGDNVLTGIKINVGKETTLDGNILRIAGNGQAIYGNDVKFPEKYVDDLIEEGYTTKLIDGLVQVTGIAADIEGKEAYYNGSYYATLNDAISAANNANSPIYLTKDVVIENKIDISKSLTLDLNNYSINYKECTCQNDDHRMFQIRETSSKGAVEVTIKNGSIKNTAYKGRCVETRTGNVTLNLNDVVMEASGKYAQPLTITGENTSSYQNIKVNIIRTNISADNGYAINTFNPVEMKIEGSEVSGWCTLNIKNNSTTATAYGSTGSVFTITNSTMDGNNTLDPGSSNSFGTFVIEESNITINTTGSTTLAKAQGTEENSQHIFVISKRGGNVLTNININVGKETTLEGYILRIAGDGQTIGNNILKFPAKYKSLLRAEGYTTEPVDDDLIQVTAYNAVPENAVACDESTYYTSLVDAVGNTTTDEIVIIKDSEGPGIVINKSITIDFNGKTYSFTTPAVGSTGTTTNGFQILQGNKSNPNSVILKNGILNVKEEYKNLYYILIQNYANLRVTDMFLDGTNLDRYSTSTNPNDGDSYVLSNNCGEVFLTGNTSIKANNESKIVDDNGYEISSPQRNFAFDSYDYTSGGYETTPIVTVETDGVINGAIAVSATLRINKIGEDSEITRIDMSGDGQLYHNGITTTVTKTVTGTTDGWGTISSPLSGNSAFSGEEIAINGLITGSTHDLYRYNETKDLWENVKATAFTSLEAGRGYLYANTATTTVGFTGLLNASEIFVNLSCTEGKTFQGFNMIGNPFTYDIDHTHFATENGAVLANGFYVMGEKGAWVAKADNAKIGAMESVFVKTDKANTLTINPKTPGSKSRGENNGMLEINVANAKYNDVAYVSFNKGLGLDKIAHRNNEIPMVYVPVDGTDYAVAMMSKDVTEIPVSFMAMTMGEYTFSAKAIDCEFEQMYLVDRMTGIETNLLMDDYTFMAKSGDNAERFIIRLENSANANTNTEKFVFVNNDELIFNNIAGEGIIRIIDVLGRPVAEYNVYGSANISTTSFRSGVYMIQMSDENGVKVQKVIVD